MSVQLGLLALLADWTWRKTRSAEADRTEGESLALKVHEGAKPLEK